MFKRISVILCIVVAVMALGISCLIFTGNLTSSVGKSVHIYLSRGGFNILQFSPKAGPPSALILFASGDGGWSDLEEGISRKLQKEGYEVIGIDSTLYAETDYDLSILQFDLNTIVQFFQKTHPGHPLPLVLGGYSMGAAQMIAGAGGPHPPPNLVGLLLIDPLSRGRYGLRNSDILNILPTGEGTFGMKEFAKSMGNLRVVQWHASDDSVDSYTWLDALTAQHKEFTFPNEDHTYSSHRTAFIRQFVESLHWILHSGSRADVASERHD